MAKPMRTCIVCGKQHEYCGYCSKYDSLPTWKFLFDTENCKDVFHAVSDYLQGEITEDVARERLSKCNLSVKDEFNDKIKETLALLFPVQGSIEELDIVEEEKPAKRTQAVRKNKSVD